mgnify:CR=1 FL=1
MNFLDTLLGKKNDSVIGVDIGSSAIKIVQIKKKKGKAVLETYGELALGPYAGIEIGRATNLPMDKIAEALTDVLREANTTTKQCGITLPLSSSLITFMTVPTTDEKQLGGMVTLEARKYIPVPITEVMLDWSIIPRDDIPENTDTPQTPEQKNSTDVLMVAIHNEVLANYQGLANKTGLQPTFFEIELFSSIRAVLEQGVTAQMVVDMGASATKLYIIDRGILRTSHVINKGSQDITLAISQSLSISVAEAENMKRTLGLNGGPEHKELSELITVTLDYIFYEANQVLFNYQKKYNKTISKVIMTGGGVLLKGFPDIAKTSFQNEVIYADPFAKLEAPAFLAEQFKVAGPEFAIAIGAALRRLSEVE